MRCPLPAGVRGEYYDSDEESSSSSVDSAAERAEAAAKRLRDYGSKDDTATSSALPSALDAFGTVAGPPAFLDPEATRQVARSAMHGSAVAAGSKATGRAADPSAGPGLDFDVARLAPPLKVLLDSNNCMN